jgi:hypothetical protein
MFRVLRRSISTRRRFQQYFAPGERNLTPLDAVPLELRLDVPHFGVISPRESECGSPPHSLPSVGSTSSSSLLGSPMHRTIQACLSRNGTPRADSSSPTNPSRRVAPPSLPRSGNPRTAALLEAQRSPEMAAVPEHGSEVCAAQAFRANRMLDEPIVLSRSLSPESCSSLSISSAGSPANSLPYGPPSWPSLPSAADSTSWDAGAKRHVRFFWGSWCSAAAEDFIDSLCSDTDGEGAQDKVVE